MPTELDLKIARYYKQLVHERYPGTVQEVRLFGSRARGDSHKESDLDLFVLLKADDDRRWKGALQELAWDAQAEFGHPYSVVPMVMTPGHFERLLALERRLAADIRAEGIPI